MSFKYDYVALIAGNLFTLKFEAREKNCHSVTKGIIARSRGAISVSHLRQQCPIMLS